MNVPTWLTWAVAAMVTIFGLYRLRIAFRSRADDLAAKQRGGLYGLPRRTHLLFGVLYLLLGAFLAAAAMGVIKSPFSDQPADDKAPATPGGVEVIEVE